MVVVVRNYLSLNFWLEMLYKNINRILNLKYIPILSESNHDHLIYFLKQW